MRQPRVLNWQRWAFADICISRTTQRLKCSAAPPQAGNLAEEAAGDYGGGGNLAEDDQPAESFEHTDLILGS